MKHLTLLLTVVALLVVAGPAQAVDFNVTTDDDELDAGACSSGDPDCSLREAIDAANAAGSVDVVNVPAGEYVLTIPADGTPNDNEDGDLDILDELTLAGAGANAVTIDAGGDSGVGDRVIDAPDPGVGDAAPATIRGVTVTGGRANEDGGGIRADGPMTVDGIVADDNQAGSGSEGGGIVEDGGEPMTIRNSVFTNNIATYGGGISQNGGGPVDIFDTRVIGNRAEGDDGSYGGGIVEDGGNVVRIFRTEVTGNTVEGYLGGGVAENGGGTGSGTLGVFIQDSLIANNRLIDPSDEDGVFARGGGVGEDGGARVEIENSTISGNSVTGLAKQQAHGGGVGETGGGGDGVGPAITLLHVTLADNTVSQGTGQNAYTNEDPISFKNSIVSGGNCVTDEATITSNGHNIDSGSTCGFGATGDQSNTDPLLAALADNGGFTQTRALQSGSPAIDSADAAACPDHDQRQVARPQLGGCDKGAYEFQPASSGAPAAGPAPAAGAPRATLALRVAGTRRACVSRRVVLRVRARTTARLRTVTVSLDGRRIRRSTRGVFRLNVNVRRLRAGRHTLRIVATDTAGNRRVSTRRFTRCARRAQRRVAPRFTG